MTNAKMRILAVIASICFFFLYTASATAADVGSANYMIEDCRIVASGATPQTDHMFQAGVCIGRIDALSDVAVRLEDKRYRSCRPTDVTIVQIAKVVVTYLDQNPARLHEPFNSLALEAFAHAWPCGPPDTLGDILRQHGIEPTK